MTETVQMNQTGHRSKIFIGAFIAMLLRSAILLLTLFMPSHLRQMSIRRH